jgi:hypothetical protein
VGPGAPGSPGLAAGQRSVGRLAPRNPLPRHPVSLPFRTLAGNRRGVQHKNTLPLVVPVVVAVLLGGGCARVENPTPHGGVLPLSGQQAAGLRGAELDLPRENAADLPLAGRRVRLVGQVSEVAGTSGVGKVLQVVSEGSQVLLRLPGRLEDPSRLAAGQDWEVLARLGEPVRLEDGRQAISVAPDIVVKTPGPPASERPTDVVVRLRAAEFFVDPAIAAFDAREPLYRLTEVGEKARFRVDFNQPGPSGLATAVDAQGRRFLDYRSVTRSSDGRQYATRCVFRIEGGHLRNVGFGRVEIAPDGVRSQEHWADLEQGASRDSVSGKTTPFPANTYGTPCLGFAVAGFPGETESVVRFHLSSGSGDISAAYAVLDGTESVTTRGRSEAAWRIKLGIDIRRSAALVDIPDSFRDYAEATGEAWYGGESTYWLAERKPHEVLRYRGLLGPPGTPDVLIERIR